MQTNQTPVYRIAAIPAMEDEARWRMGNHHTGNFKIPDWLDCIYAKEVISKRPLGLNIRVGARCPILEILKCMSAVGHLTLALILSPIEHFEITLKGLESATPGSAKVICGKEKP